MNRTIRVTIWNEFRHERDPAHPARDIYPDGIHTALAEGLSQSGLAIHTATLDEPEHGLTDEVLGATDVLLWWGHAAHEEVSDQVVKRVHNRVVRNGMGLICLHSAHFSRIFKQLMGTTCDLKWREAGERERLWVVEPGHPIAEGIGEYFEIPKAEMYGERFDIPAPDELVFLSWFEGGEVFRSGCCFRPGQGKLFYFRPGHESYPIYRQPEVQRILINACRWAAPTGSRIGRYGNVPPIERIGR